jgi:hypothetical protein
MFLQMFVDSPWCANEGDGSERYFSPQPTVPLLGFSFASISRSARHIRSPIWTSNSDYGTHSCRISSFIDPSIDEVEVALEGLTLKDSRPE